jgi:hypothetical protein
MLVVVFCVIHRVYPTLLDVLDSYCHQCTLVVLQEHISSQELDQEVACRSSPYACNVLAEVEVNRKTFAVSFAADGSGQSIASG